MITDNMMEQRIFNCSQRSTARLLFIVCYLLFIISVLPAAAQKKRTPAVPVTEQAQKALDAYAFQEAEDILNKEIAALKRRRKDTSLLDKLLQAAHIGINKIHATERVVIIDSIVCPKEEVLQTIRLSEESGRIDTYASTYHTKDTLGATLYENEFSNRRYIAVATSSDNGTNSTLRIGVSDKIGDKWSTPSLIGGLNEDDICQNYPFLLSDGITLYYAAKGPESMGGYDIFVTRSSDEEGRFLEPENIGFPFNSPANDYLYAIDELNNIGWFVSDRRQPEGKVCIYVFIPNDTRELYGDEVTDKELQDLARITAIRDTWNVTPSNEGNASSSKKKVEIDDALQRFHELCSGSKEKLKKPEFYFPIDDQRTYYYISDFRSSVARDRMSQWIQLSKNLETDNEMLQRLRDNYATADKTERQKLRDTILRIEDAYYPQLQQLELLGKEIRNAEILNK